VRRRRSRGSTESRSRSPPTRGAGPAFAPFFGFDDARDGAEVDDPSVAYESREAAAGVHRLLSKLSEKKRTVFVLFELEELSGEEIAEAVGVPLATVWTRLFHARKEFTELAKAARRE